MNDHYSILGVSRQTSPAEIANAYRQLLLRERQEKGDQADFAAYSLAYRTLTNPSKRAEYDRFLDELSGKYSVKNPETPTEAEKCYLAGVTCMEQKNFQDAVDYLYRAVQLEPENSHFCSQLGLALGMFKDRLAEAERYCKKAINLDPDNPDFRYNLGFLYQRHNLVDAAQTAFDLANEAIRSRQVRLLKENEPLITPWGEEGQNLLEEISRLETMFDEVGRTEAEAAEITEPAAPAAPEPAAIPEVLPQAAVDLQPEPATGALEELVTESDLLRQLDELESKVTKTELAQALASTADQAEAPMEKFLDDDLLKELDLLEARVRGVEEFHNGEIEKSGQGALPEAEVQAEIAVRGQEPAVESITIIESAKTSASAIPLPSAEPIGDDPQAASQITDDQRELSLAATLSQSETTGEENLAQVWLKEPTVETVEEKNFILSESLASGQTAEIVLPEALREMEAAPASSAEPLLESFPGDKYVTASGLARESESRELPRAAAVEKLRMLEELEKEMLGELENLRREKAKIQAQA